ncbi:hypothetical protein QAD02_024012 [Eretmocerus hayati]|uniref:Uncharacterized protein n=1 Tax=Eretmocerus hayati TaxID=131215 RepID=A0ACC2PXU3_9HYME|nr:hypothetical protein QAD02_024012 [Eretmocerus hayati]
MWAHLTKCTKYAHFDLWDGGPQLLVLVSVQRSSSVLLYLLKALLVFYVPSESGEKVTLGISALLSMTVFLMTIRETLPPTEKTPLISLYYGVSICLVSFASGLAVVTLNLHHRGVRGVRVPPGVKSFVLDKLARIVFLNFQEESVEPTRRKNYQSHCKSEMSTRDHQAQPARQPSQHISPNYVGRRHASDYSSPTLELGKDATNLSTHQLQQHHQQQQHHHQQLGSGEAIWLRLMGRLQATNERNERRLLEQDLRERRELEWKQVAIVSDRLLLGIFFFTTAVSTAVILCGSPPDASPEGSIAS